METIFLKCNEEAKRALEVLENIASGPLSKMSPHIFLRADSGAGITTFGKLYQNILDKHDIFGEGELCDYLELVLPGAEINEKIRALFYASAKEKARSLGKNVFNGIFCISLEEFEEVNLGKNVLFDEFIQYVYDNREVMRFIFTCSPTATNAGELEARFHRVLSGMESIQINMPNAKTVAFYLEQKLKEHISLDKAGKLMLNKLAERLITHENFAGYRMLDFVAEKILFSCLSNGNLCITPGKEVFSNAYDAVFECFSPVEKERKMIGFR